ncbi:hypothetical protein FQN57_000316 [Myotisia sp. PD_48]|nr:hypothetical protein FQN57_000316 [Myotisia sp. PD_48]
MGKEEDISAQIAHHGQEPQDHDREELRRLGKKQVLRRNFRFLSVLGFSCAVLITWEASLILFVTGLTNGGTAGLIYGYLVVWSGNFAVFATLSELVSMAPTSGGQYHWVAMLAPRWCNRFLSYMTGWLTVAGWQATIASACFLVASMIQGLVLLTNPGYEATPWQATLIFWAVLLYCVLINTVMSRLLPAFETLALALHLIGFVAVLVPLVRLGPKGDAKMIFTTFLNGGNWPNQGISFLVGLVGHAFAFLGLDGAYHMAEEIQHPSVVVPRSIMLTVLINGGLGFGMLIATLFSIVDIEKALNSPTHFPFMEIFYQSNNSIVGSAVMASIILSLAMTANCNVLASSSRMMWSFSRDRGLPGWKFLSLVEKRTGVPLVAIFVTSTIAVLLSLINVGSTTAFNIVVSLSVACLYLSYLLAVGLLLYRRCTGGISTASDSPTILANTAGTRLVWGPWNFRGAIGVIINLLACLYLILILCFSFFPVATPTTPETMNYSSLLIGSIIIFSIIYYLIYARKTYEGPIVEVEATCDGRLADVP